MFGTDLLKTLWVHDVEMTSMRRRYVASISLRRHVPAGNLAPLGPPIFWTLAPQYSKPSYAYALNISHRARSTPSMVVGCFGLNGPLRQYFNLYRAVSQGEGGKKRNDRPEKKMSKQHPPAPTVSAAGPCPTIIQISRTHRHWKFTHYHRTTRPFPTSHRLEQTVIWSRAFMTNLWNI